MGTDGAVVGELVPLVLELEQPTAKAPRNRARARTLKSFFMESDPFIEEQ